jgi:hypothetical protein
MIKTVKFGHGIKKEEKTELAAKRIDYSFIQ